MRIVHYKGKTYHVHTSGQIWCVYKHPKGGATTSSRKLSPTGRMAWEVRKQMAKQEKDNG